MDLIHIISALFSVQMSNLFPVFACLIKNRICTFALYRYFKRGENKIANRLFDDIIPPIFSILLPMVTYALVHVLVPRADLSVYLIDMIIKTNGYICYF